MANVVRYDLARPSLARDEVLRRAPAAVCRPPLQGRHIGEMLRVEGAREGSNAPPAPPAVPGPGPSWPDDLFGWPDGLCRPPAVLRGLDGSELGLPLERWHGPPCQWG